jgi:hypothetical protein
MTKQQNFAFEYPCLAEEQDATDGYRWLRFPSSLILTLNIGVDDASIFDGLPLGHCSVALLDSRGLPQALELWNDDEFTECQRLIRAEVLMTIGDPAHEHVQLGDRAFHFRRCCSEKELCELNVRRFWPRPQDRTRWT